MGLRLHMNLLISASHQEIGLKAELNHTIYSYNDKYIGLMGQK